MNGGTISQFIRKDRNFTGNYKQILTSKSEVTLYSLATERLHTHVILIPTLS